MNEPQPIRTHYIHRMKYSVQERLVGLFVLLGIAILIGLLFLSGQTLQLFEGRVEFTAYMRNALGINADTKVRISGIEAGSVKNITLNQDSRFKVKFIVYKRFRNLVRLDSKASISKLAFIGDSVINISPGSENQPLLPNGGVIEFEETLTLDQIISNLKPVLEKIDSSIDKIATVVSALPNDALVATLKNTAATTTDLKQITQQISSGQGTLGALTFDQQLHNKLSTSVDKLSNALKDIEQTAELTYTAARDLPMLIQQFTETAGIIRQEVEKLPEVSLETRQLLDDMQTVVDAISHTWPISSKIDQTPAPSPLLEVAPSNE